MPHCAALEVPLIVLCSCVRMSFHVVFMYNFGLYPVARASSSRVQTGIEWGVGLLLAPSGMRYFVAALLAIGVGLFVYPGGQYE